MSLREDVDSAEPLQQNEFKPAPKKVGIIRFIVAALLSISLLLTCEIWISLAAVSVSTKTFFQINKSSTADWFSVVFFVTFAIQAIPSLFLPQLIGIKRCLVAGTSLILIGCLLRCAAFLLGYSNGTTANYTVTAFWMAMLGNVVVSFSQCLLNNIPSLVSSEYFEEAQQLTSTTWIINGCILGTAVGFIFPPLVMGAATEIVKIQEKFLIITFTECVISALLFVTSIFVIPSTASSLGAASKDGVNNTFKSKWTCAIDSIKESFIDVWHLLKSPTFFSLFIIYGLYYAISSMFYIILSDIIDENLGSNTTTLISYTGSLAVISGAIFSAVLNVVIEKFGSFRFSFRVSSLLMLMNALPLFIIFMLSHYKKHTPTSISILAIFYGMVAAPYLSLGYDIMSKAAAPISANVPVTIALVFSNVLSVILTYGGEYIPKDKRNQIFLVLFTCLYIGMCITHAFVKVKPLPPNI